MSLLVSDYVNIAKIYAVNKPQTKIQVKLIPVVNCKARDEEMLVSSSTPILFVTNEGIKLRIFNAKIETKGFLILNCDINVWTSVRVSEFDLKLTVIDLMLFN